MTVGRVAAEAGAPALEGLRTPAARAPARAALGRSPDPLVWRGGHLVAVSTVPYGGLLCRWQWALVAWGPGLSDVDARACTAQACAECHGGPVPCAWCRPGQRCGDCFDTRIGSCNTCPPAERCEVGATAIRCAPPAGAVGARQAAWLHRCTVGPS